jgi:hypothetical protein
MLAMSKFRLSPINMALMVTAQTYALILVYGVSVGIYREQRVQRREEQYQAALKALNLAP